MESAKLPALAYTSALEASPKNFTAVQLAANAESERTVDGRRSDLGSRCRAVQRARTGGQAGRGSDSRHEARCVGARSRHFGRDADRSSCE